MVSSNRTLATGRLDDLEGFALAVDTGVLSPVDFTVWSRSAATFQLFFHDIDRRLLETHKAPDGKLTDQREDRQ